MRWTNPRQIPDDALKDESRLITDEERELIHAVLGLVACEDTSLHGGSGTLETGRPMTDLYLRDVLSIGRSVANTVAADYDLRSKANPASA